jgi:hypothetical protein
MAKISRKLTFGDIFDASKGRLIESDKEYYDEDSPRIERSNYD